LLATPCSDQAANNVAVSLPGTNFATKLMDNDALPSNNDIYKITDNWMKTFEEFFTPQISPPTADPSQQELTPQEITYKGGAPSTTTPTSTSATPAQEAPQPPPPKPAIWSPVQ
jgi:hypothetical protein